MVLQSNAVCRPSGGNIGTKHNTAINFKHCCANNEMSCKYEGQ